MLRTKKLIYVKKKKKVTKKDTCGKKKIHGCMDKKIVGNTLTQMLIYNIGEVILETCVKLATTFLTE